MDSEAPSDLHLRAGQEYLEALHALGLRPEFFSWGKQRDTGEWLLVMVTPAFEVGGPLALHRLLFKAYNMRATPQEISPFIVRVFGRRSLPAQRFIDVGQAQRGYGYVVDRDGSHIPVESLSYAVGDLEVFSRFAYLLKAPSRSARQINQEWARFKSNVEKLAA